MCRISGVIAEPMQPWFRPAVEVSVRLDFPIRCYLLGVLGIALVGFSFYEGFIRQRVDVRRHRSRISLSRERDSYFGKDAILLGALGVIAGSAVAAAAWLRIKKGFDPW